MEKATGTRQNLIRADSPDDLDHTNSRKTDKNIVEKDNPDDIRIAEKRRK